MTMQQLAEQWAGQFQRETREGSPIPLVTANERDEHLGEAIESAHGDMFPDDWRYLMIANALSDFAECEDDGDDEGTLRDAAVGGWDGSQYLIYTHYRTHWLSSRNDRAGYCNEFVQEQGLPDAKTFDVVEVIAWGMLSEFQEVVSSLLDSLQARCAQIEAA